MELAPYQKVSLTKKDKSEDFLQDLKRQPLFDQCRMPPEPPSETEIDKKTKKAKKIGLLFEIVLTLTLLVAFGRGYAGL